MVLPTWRRGAADRISMRRFSLTPAMNELLVRLAQKDLEAVRVLRDAVAAMGSDLRETIGLARQVDKMESEADDIFADLYQACSRWTPTSRPSISLRRLSNALRVSPTVVVRMPS